MPFTISQASLADAEAIAHIFNEIDDNSELLRLQLGSSTQNENLTSLTERIKSNMAKPEQHWMVAKDDETREVMSYAQWVFPQDEVELFPSSDDEDGETQTEADYRKSLPEGMNLDLVHAFRSQIQTLRKKCIRGRRNYLLSNLGTAKSYRRRGAASSLVRYIFSRADSEDTIVYLDTDESGNAKDMYENLGFVYVDKSEIDLRKYGGTGTHVHISMIREPQQKDAVA